jgi:hypothetical protein
MESRRVRRKLSIHTERQSPRKFGRCDGGLRRRAEHDRGPVILRELIERGEAGSQHRKRNGLRLVEHDHGIGKVVQLPAMGGAIGVEALELLHIGRHDHGRRPIFHGEAKLFCGLAAAGAILVDRRVMLEHDALAEQVAEYRRRLVDYRRKGNGVDDPFEPVAPRMLEREGERGQRLAPSGRHGEREQAAIDLRAGAHMPKYVGA